jgi:WD40 repeat protein
VSDGLLLRTLVDTGDIVSVAFSKDGQTLASGVFDQNVNISLWRTSDGVLLDRTNSLFCPSSIAFSPDCQSLAVGGWSGIGLWRLSGTGQPSDSVGGKSQ